MPNLVETVAPAIGALLHELESSHGVQLHGEPRNGEASAATLRADVHAPVLAPTLRGGFDTMPCAAVARPGRESGAP